MLLNVLNFSSELCVEQLSIVGLWSHSWFSSWLISHVTFELSQVLGTSVTFYSACTDTNRLKHSNTRVTHVYYTLSIGSTTQQRQRCLLQCIVAFTKPRPTTSQWTSLTLNPQHHTNTFWVFGSGRRVPKSHSSSCCCYQFSESKNP